MVLPAVLAVVAIVSAVTVAYRVNTLDAENSVVAVTGPTGPAPNILLVDDSVIPTGPTGRSAISVAGPAGVAFTGPTGPYRHSQTGTVGQLGPQGPVGPSGPVIPDSSFLSTGGVASAGIIAKAGGAAFATGTLSYLIGPPLSTVSQMCTSINGRVSWPSLSGVNPTGAITLDLVSPYNHTSAYAWAVGIMLGCLPSAILNSTCQVVAEMPPSSGGMVALYKATSGNACVPLLASDLTTGTVFVANTIIVSGILPAA